MTYCMSTILILQISFDLHFAGVAQVFDNDWQWRRALAVAVQGQFVLVAITKAFANVTHYS